MKTALLTLSLAPMAAGLTCFGVLMHDVVSSGNAGRPRLQHSDATIGRLALSALILPHLSVIPLWGAQRLEDRAERV